jgi:hypothetical protein
MKEFFGYERDVKPNGQILSSEFATISLNGSGAMSLVQSVEANYGQTVAAKFAIGSPTLYWLTGRPGGQIAVSRLVGPGGFLSNFNGLADSCGSLLGIVLGTDGKGGCVAAQNNSGGKLRFDGGVVDRINISFNANALEITEAFTIQVASMYKG